MKREREGDEEERDSASTVLRCSPFGGSSPSSSVAKAAPPGTVDETLEVAAHYSARPNGSVEERETSRIIALRKSNNWVKSALIEQFCGQHTGVIAFDLCGGKGGDLGKWAKRGARHVVLADIALESVRQAVDRYSELFARSRSRSGGGGGGGGYHHQQQPPLFTATWICADCTRVDLSRHIPTGLCFDIVSCQFALHYSFGSEATARGLLMNAASRLRPGGYFVGAIPNADELVRRLKAAPGLEFGNSVYHVRFDSKTEFPRFGARYTFTLVDAVDAVPEYLVHFGTLVKLAQEYGLDFQLCSSFDKFQKEVSVQNPQLAAALQRSLGCKQLSPEEHEAFSLYQVFAFRKRPLPPPPYTYANIKVVSVPAPPS